MDLICVIPCFPGLCEDHKRAAKSGCSPRISAMGVLSGRWGSGQLI